MSLSHPTVSSVLRVKNNEPNATVFTKTVNGDILRIMFAASGHTGDTQRVPVSLAGDIDFLNSVESGILTVIDGPAEILELLSADTSSIRQQRIEEQRALTEQALDRRADRDMHAATCIGPNAPGRNGNCDKPLIQSSAQSGEIPPLCSLHEHLANNYLLTEEGSKGEGATASRAGIVRREWREVQMGARRTTT